MEKLLRYFGTLDWLVAGGTLVVGLYLQNWWVAAAGVFGLGMAYVQPAKRMHALVARKLVRKRDRGEGSTANVQQDEAFYAEVLGKVQTADDAAAAPERPKRTFASAPVPYGQTFISRSKHNRLKVAHLGLFVQTSSSRFH